MRPDSPAAAAGFLPGDRFVSVDGTAGRDLRRRAAPGFGPRRRCRSSSSCCATARRSTLTATPEIIEQNDALGNIVKVGVIGVVNNEELGQPRVDHLQPGRRRRRGRARDRPHRRAHRPVPEAFRRSAARTNASSAARSRSPTWPARRPSSAFEWLVQLVALLSVGHRNPQPAADSAARRRAPRLLRRWRPSSAVRCRNGRWKRSIAPGFCWFSASWGSCSGTTCLDVEIMKEFGLAGCWVEACVYHDGGYA